MGLQLCALSVLMQAIWPDVSVTDESITKCIVDVRKALDDDSQELVRTIAKRGYLFGAPVTMPVMELPQRLGAVPPEPLQRAAGEPANRFNWTRAVAVTWQRRSAAGLHASRDSFYRTARAREQDRPRGERDPACAATQSVPPLR
jgi:hypothetical protein